MKIKENFVRREVAGNYVVVALGSAGNNFNGMMKLNSTGNFLWERLESGATREELVLALIDEYEVEKDKAEASADAFVKELERLGCIE